MKEWHANTLLFCASIALTLGVAEVGARLLWKEPTHFLHQVLPGGMHMEPNTEDVYKTNEFEFKVSSNRFGHRDWQWTDAVMKDPCNIVFIGDSFVFGYGVDDAYTVPTQLERQLAKDGRKTEVFNLGLGGGLPEYTILTREATEQEGIEAKTILIGLFLGNDFTEEPVYTKAEPVKAGWSMHLRMPHPSDSALYRLLKLRASSSAGFTGLMFRVGNVLGVDLYPTNTGYIFIRDWKPAQKALFDSFLNRMLDIKAIADRHQRNLGFVIFPNRVQVENAADLTSAVYDASMPDQRILEFCGQHGLDCLDLLPRLRGAYDRDKKPLFFPVDRHMNASGNALAAEGIAEHLRNRKLMCGVDADAGK